MKQYQGNVFEEEVDSKATVQYDELQRKNELPCLVPFVFQIWGFAIYAAAVIHW